MVLFLGPLLPSGESPARLTTPRGRSPLAPSLLFSLAPVPNYSESMAICKPSKIVNDYLEKVAVKLTPGLPDVGDLPPWDSPQMLVVAQEKSAERPLALSLTVPI